MSCRLVLVFLVSALTAAARASAQTLPETPITAFDGKVVVGAEVVATVGDRDDSTYFNYTDYEHNAFRMFRLALAASWRPASRIAIVGEIRSEDLNHIRPYAAYVRVRPWSGHAFDIQAGQIPPSFGAFGRRGYNVSDNPLIGYPLAYQYLTAVRPDAIPATIADLISMRARGWRVTYPIGSQDADPGVPLVSAFRWDTGVQGHWEGRMVDVTGGITTGTLSDPRVADSNGGKQLSGRIGVKPIMGLIVGVSGARGDFLDDDVKVMLPDPDASHPQTAFGADAEYSRGHWLVRSELVWSRWNIPILDPPRAENLDALGTWVEGRYRLTPRIYVAGRVDRLTFSRIEVGPNVWPTWDAAMRRVEANAGYYIRRNIIARAAIQFNQRDGGRIRKRTYFSGQLAYWF